MSHRNTEDPVVVIGGGGTGIATAYDLALQGVPVLLFEKGEFTSGTTGRHHGQLHCGARYVVADEEIGRECWEESVILRRIIPQAVEYNGGYFLGFTSEDADYSLEFLDGCRRAGIPAKKTAPKEVFLEEPAVSRKIKTAIAVPDGSFDAFRLPMAFLASALHHGAKAYRFSEVIALEKQDGRVSEVIVRQAPAGRERAYTASAVVNAAGPWTGEVAALAGGEVPIIPAPGTLVAVRGRLCNHVLSRLRPPGDGDILVPQRNQTIIGTTEWTTKMIDGIQSRKKDLPFLMDCASVMVPDFSDKPVVSTWAAARPLAGGDKPGPGDGERRTSRDFSVVSGTRAEGFFSVLGGKATVLRAMAEEITETVLDFLGKKRIYSTKDFPLRSWREVYPVLHHLESPEIKDHRKDHTSGRLKK